MKEIKEGVLPESLEKLSFTETSYPFVIKKGVLPSGLKKIKFIAYDFAGNFEEGALPENLEVIGFYCGGMKNLNMQTLPRNLKKIAPTSFQNKYIKFMSKTSNINNYDEKIAN